ncbi:unnamed protein product [Ostreobium quekettii]|uniref:Uncharacterized protein n=1 Tax=Ostreobium quekettii TaxID=121088 RepID=A0A8S1ISC0_9CHLO|nr:unnamed protein product [Ostreobium quekettii]
MSYQVSGWVVSACLGECVSGPNFGLGLSLYDGCVHGLLQTFWQECGAQPAFATCSVQMQQHIGDGAVSCKSLQGEAARGSVTHLKRSWLRLDAAPTGPKRGLEILTLAWPSSRH